MKLMLCGDWHIDNTRPERRIDDYWKTVQDKISFILRLAKENDCLILQPGDFFNSHRTNDFLKRYVIMTLKALDLKVLTVFGQHDLRYHSSDVKNTPLGVLQASGVVVVLGFDPVTFWDFSVYGASWYEDIPKIEDIHVNNILVIHRMIIKNSKLWDGQEDATFGNILLKTSGYRLIVSGDNHNHFTISTKANRHLVNCGSLLRTKIDQVDHTPLVYIYDTDDQTITPHEVPHEPFDKVFNMEKYNEEKKEDEKLNAFVDRLDGDVELEGLDFIKNMDSYVAAQKDLDETTLGIIEEVMA